MCILMYILVEKRVTETKQALAQATVELKKVQEHLEAVEEDIRVNTSRNKLLSEEVKEAEAKTRAKDAVLKVFTHIHIYTYTHPLQCLALTCPCVVVYGCGGV